MKTKKTQPVDILAWQPVCYSPTHLFQLGIPGEQKKVSKMFLKMCRLDVSEMW